METKLNTETGEHSGGSLCSQIPAEVDALARKALLAVDAWSIEVNTLKSLMLDADSLLSLIGHRGMIADSEQKHDIERRCIALSGKLRAAYENDTTALKSTRDDLYSANVPDHQQPENNQ
jgi:hypothetical protein